MTEHPRTLTFTLPLPMPSKKNGRRAFASKSEHTYIVASESWKNYEDKAIVLLKNQLRQQTGSNEWAYKKEPWFEVDMHAYYLKNQHADRSNLLTGIDDLLQDTKMSGKRTGSHGAGIIPDDNQIMAGEPRVFLNCEDGGYITITVTPYDPEA